jgi:plasmid stabilization system protein ParE
MPQVIITPAAQRGLDRCGAFLEENNLEAAKRAAQVIKKHFRLLETMPNSGKPFPKRPAWNQVIIPFGDSGYLALYRYEPSDDAVYILAFRHQKELKW